ncbi:MAG TPA: hypothetical protein VJO33_02375 [Gemmatimonadaceae bacterium]|nr:hypothetical protein [Gemmatimonadaceae bacterium]
MDAAQTKRWEEDPEYRYEISEVCAVTLAEHGWVGNEVRVVGRGPNGSYYLDRFRYDSA